MNQPPVPATCPQCRAALPADAPQGLCPACLLAAVAEPTEAGSAPAPRTPPPTRDQVAAAFPQLEILELIGAGGMGYVFKARQPKLDRLVALKLLPPHLGTDPAFATRFEREGRLLARLSHPNIVTVHDFGFAQLPLPHSPDAIPSPGFFYLLMEYVDGANLRQALRAGRFTPAQALAVVPKICEALQFAHDQGILHRDIKPENILLDAKGRVKLVDFGIAKLIGPAEDIFPADSKRPQMGKAGADGNQIGGRLESVGKSSPSESALTSATAALGTPSYMAPEQRDRPADVDHRADIYSLGVVFYEMLTGELPLGQFAPPSTKSTSDPRVDEVVLRALEQQREHRQQSAGEIKTQVETIAATGRAPATTPADPLGVSRGSVWPLFWLAFSPVAIGTGLMLMLIPRSGATDESGFNPNLQHFAIFVSFMLFAAVFIWFTLKLAKANPTPPALLRLMPGLLLGWSGLEFYNSRRDYGVFLLGLALSSFWTRERLGTSAGAKCLLGAGYAIAFGGVGLMWGKSHLPEAWQTWLRTPADTSLASALMTLAVLATVAVIGWLTPLLFGLSPRDAGKREQAPTSFLKYPGLLMLLLPVLLFGLLLIQFYPQLESSDGDAPRTLPQAGPAKPSTSEGLALMTKLRAHYEQATNLVVEGHTVTTMLRTNQPAFVQANKFELKLGRPSLYQVRWTASPVGSHGHRGAVWSDGGINWFWMNGSTPEARASRELTLGSGVGISQNVTGWLPTLFFGNASWVETLGDLRLEPDAVIEGEPCAVLVGSARGNPTRMWISKRDFLLRQVEFLNTISAEFLARASSDIPLGSTIRTVQTYRVVTGQTLTAADFKFTPPGASK